MRFRRFGMEAEVVRVGKYELGEELGQGPLGKAFAATDTETGKKVVIRGFVRPEDADEEFWQRAIQRFNEELDAVKKLEHPNIVRLIEFGELNGVYFIVTEFFIARNLRRVIDEDPSPSVDEVLSLMAKVAEVFDYALLYKISHGDITPFNLLLPVDNPRDVKVLNYGIARVRKKMGSPYLAPEQLTGFSGDHRSDFYSLGVVVYEWLTKRCPFAGETAEETAHKILTVVPPPIPNVPPFLNDILSVLLAKDPDERYQSGEDLIRDLKSRHCSKIALQRPVRTAITLDAMETPFTYQPTPSLADYQLSQSDLKEIQRRITLQKLEAERKKELAARWAILTVTLITLGAFFGYSAHRYANEGEVKSKLLTGSVFVLLTSSQKWEQKTYLDELSSGDFLRTDQKGKVLLQMADGSRMLVYPQTTLQIRAVGMQGRKRRRSFSLLNGRVFVSARTIYGGVHQFKIFCPQMRLKIKGTDFSVQVRETFTKIATLKGVLETTLGNRVQIVPDGQKLLCDFRAGEINLQSLTDKELKELKQTAEFVALSSWEEFAQKIVDTGEKIFVLPIATVIGSILSGKQIYEEALTDAQAQSRAITSIRAICVALEGGSEYLRTIGLTDLSGLGLGEKEVRSILSAFEDNRLLSYHSDGQNFEFTARLKDTHKTFVRVQNGKIYFERRKAEEEE